LLMFKLKNYKVISLRLRQDLDLVLPPLKLRLPAYWRRMPTRLLYNIFPQVQMIATKHTLVLEVLELLIQNTAMTTKSIESLGRLQWAIAVCPLTKSLLQPSWAWKMGLLALLMKAVSAEKTSTIPIGMNPSLTWKKNHKKANTGSTCSTEKARPLESGSVEDLSPDDFRNEMGLYGKCTRCFKSHDLPLEYQQGPAQVNDAPVDSDSSNESGRPPEMAEIIDLAHLVDWILTLYRPYLQISKKTWKDSPRAFQCFSKQIPWRIQGELARQGYTTVEDLADRWDSPEEARNHGPRELDFTEGNHGFTAQSTAFTAMRLLQAVRAARMLATIPGTAHTQGALPRSTTPGGSPLEISLDRRTLEETYMKTYKEAQTGATGPEQASSTPRAASRFPSPGKDLTGPYDNPRHGTTVAPHHVTASRTLGYTLRPLVEPLANDIHLFDDIVMLH
ncbi:unnamed protein product, partial [Cladocopium goreaui]